MFLNREDICFPSGSDTCAGWFYKAGVKGVAPCIVMAHGFGGVKEMRLDAYAERFCAEGYHVFVFDYRHFGESGGEPRQVLDIKKQHADWHAALKYVRASPAIDLNKIILWGTSFSGGHVMQIAHEDKLVAAVISQVPHMNGLATARAGGLVHNFKLGLAAARDVLHMGLGRAPYYVGIIGEPGELSAMTGLGERERVNRLYPADRTVNETVAARVFLSVGRYSPDKFASKLRMPLLVQVAMNDITTPPKPAITAAKKAPKGELITYELGHFDVYVDPEFETTVGDQLEFLKRVV